MNEIIKRRLAILLVTATVVTDSCFVNITPAYAMKDYVEEQIEEIVEQIEEPVEQIEKLDESFEKSDESQMSDEVLVEDEKNDEPLEEAVVEIEAIKDLPVESDVVEDEQPDRNNTADVVGVLVNGERFDNGEYIIHYGDEMYFSLENGHSASFLYTDDLAEGNFDSISNGVCTLYPGTYYIGYEASSYAYFTEADGTNRFKLIVEKGQIGDATDLEWEDSTIDADNLAILMKYKLPTESKSGYPYMGTPIDSNYRIRIYKKNENNDEYTKVFDQNQTTLSYSPNATLTSNGYGNYKFSVTFKSLSSYYDDSDEVFSDIYEFKDIANPVISDFSFDRANKKLKATAKDKHTGIYAYAFTTKTNKEDILDSEWVDIALNPSEADTDKDFDYSITEGGRYYFYAKDKCGNIEKSSENIPVTILKINNTYDAGVVAGEKELFFFGDDNVSFPSSERTGFDFDGWRVGSESSENIEIAGHTVPNTDPLFGTTIILYAKWSLKDISATITPSEGVEKEYSATNTALSVDVGGISESSDVTFDYKWYKDGALIDDSNNKNYNVRNVLDSGSYYAKVTINILNEEPVEVSSESVSVNITKKALDIKANATEIDYGDGLPAFTANYTGLIVGDSASVTEGAFECPTYSAGFDVGNYDIIPVNFISDNYEINPITVTALTVKPKNVQNIGANVNATLSENEFVYDNTAKKPGVLVTDDNLNSTLVEGRDYTLTYPEPIEASDAARVVIDFTGNYTGSITKTYSITKADYNVDLSILGWKYGESPNAPVLYVIDDELKPEPSLNPSDITYLYKKSIDPDTAWSTTVPTAAGMYQVKASIKELPNYGPQVTSPVEFEITKRVIILQSESRRWTFDGNNHSATVVTEPSSATIEGVVYRADGLYVTDDFKYKRAVTIVNSVTDGTINEIDYEFSSTTNPDNYTIIKQEGTLIIDKAKLSSPSHVEWDDAHIGSAKWIAITRANLNVEYEIELYKNGAKLGDSYTTDATSYDFSSIIKADSTHDLGGYQVKVKAHPIGGSDENDYSSSDFSALTNMLYSSKIIVDQTQSGIATATINDQESIIILAGESASLSATYETGYTEAPTIWVASALSDKLSSLSITDNTKSNTTIKIASDIGGSENFTIVAHAKDELPYAAWSFDEDYASRYKSDMTKLVLDYTLQDTLELKEYAVIKLASKPLDESELTTAAATAIWTQIDNAEPVKDEQNKTIAYKSEGEYEISEKGYYYLAVKDSKNQLSFTDAFSVFEIDFERGGADVTGTMPSILKAEHYDIIQLPSEAFVRAGYSFTEWKQEGGAGSKIYTNMGMFTADANATLVAKWSNRQYIYYVNYYYMQTDGTYSEAYDEHETYSSLYGVRVTDDNPDFVKHKTGFVQDKSRGNEELTITEDNQVLNIYYKRISYKITYTYTNELDDDITLSSSQEEYLFGAPISEDTAPDTLVYTPEGYDFIGWNYDGSAIRPNTMPNHNVKATGYLAAKNTPYQINYFIQSLDGSVYNLPSDESIAKEERNDVNGKSLTFTTAEAKDIEGFTIAGVSTSTGAVGNNTFSSASSADGVVNAVAADKLQVNYFYTRNTYKISLNVWKSNKENPENILYDAYWQFKFEEPIAKEVTDAMVRYYQDLKASVANPLTKNPPTEITNKDIPDYHSIANYIDWSTGNAPAIMPAGDVTLTRAYIQNAEQAYQVEAYFQNENEEYAGVAPQVINFYAPLETEVTLINGTRPSELIDVSKLYTSQLSPMNEYFSYYELDTDKTSESGKLSGVVTESTTATEDPLVLKAYFKRKKTKITVYYMENTTDRTKSAQQIEKVVLEGVWGHDAADAFNPLMYFDNEEYKPKFPTSDKTFKNAEYVVAYSGTYILNGGYRYPTYSFKTVDSLIDKNYTKDSNGNTPVKFGISDYNLVVTYSLTDLDMYGVEVKYRDKDITGDDGQHDVKYTYNDKDYKFMLVNEDMIYSLESSGATKYAEYPGIYNIEDMENRTYSGVKPNYTEITTDLPLTTKEKPSGSKDYYTYRYFIRNDVADDEYIYIVKNNKQNQNPFINGKRYGINLVDSFVEDICVKEKILDDYNTKSPDAQKKFDNRTASGVNYCDTTKEPHTIANRTLLFTFEPKVRYRIYHFLDNSCSGHEYPEGTNLTVDQIKAIPCSMLIADKAGYTINLYKDKDGTALSAINNLSSSHTIFARREKSVIDYSKSYYYELANELPSGKYLNSTQLEAMITAGNTKVTKSTTSLASYIITDIDRKITVTPTVDTYAYEGQMCLVVERHKTFSFSEINLDFNNDAYVIDNFSFEASNPNNSLNGYCEATANNLRAYYVRDRFTLISDMDNGEDNIVSQNKVGQRVVLPKAVKDGYDLAGWNIYKGDEESGYVLDESIVVTKSGSNYELTMKNYPIKAVAIWDKAAVAFQIKYFYQANSKEYRETLFDSLTDSPVASTITLDGAAVAGKAYYTEGGELQAVSVTDGDIEKFYKAEKDRLDDIVASSLDLFAAYRIINPNTEDVIAINDYNLIDENFSYNHAVFRSDLGLENKTLADSVSVGYQTGLSYYYTRNTHLSIKIDSIATDDSKSISGATTATSAGTEVAYGDETTLTTSAGSGYTFVGWYNRADVMSGGTLKDDWNSATKLSPLATYSFRVPHSVDFVAIYIPDGFSEGITLSVTSTKSAYDYGYKSSELKNIHAGVSFPGDINQEVYIKGYEWIETDSLGNQLPGTLINNTYSDYKIATGLEAATYYYACKVTIARKDNGRELVLTTSPFEVTINKAGLHVKVDNYDGNYDGNFHSVVLSLDTENYPDLESMVKESDYEIYYQEIPFVDSGLGYDVSSASTTPIEKKDTKLLPDGKTVDSYRIYYCAKPIGATAQKNYMAVTGEFTITIHPLKLTIKTNGNGFSKIFDGTETVSGSVITEGTDKYRLSQGDGGVEFYQIEGYLPSERDILTLDFDAQFNSKHASDASAVILTNITAVYKETGVMSPNYVHTLVSGFKTSGYIKQKELNVNWSNVGPFDFDGTLKCPVASLSVAEPGVSLSVDGAQINAGSFTAHAVLASDDTVEGLELTDYKINNAAKDYSIVSQTITIEAEDTEFTYDKAEHTINTFTVNDNAGVKSGDSVVINGNTYTVKANCEKKLEAGIYELTPQDIHIFDTIGKNVTDNFALSAVSGNLTINKKPIEVKNIAAVNKVYDGTKSVVLDYSTVTFDSLESGDVITIDPSKVSAEFDTINVGNDKVVNITIEDGALKDALGVAKNYSLLTNPGETFQSSTTTANITKYEVGCQVDDVEITYADDIPFSVSPVDSSIPGKSNVKVWGDIKFTLLDQNDVEKYSYTYHITNESAISFEELSPLSAAPVSAIRPNVGRYKIAVSGIESDNYNIASTLTADLVVKEKTLTISANVVSPSNLTKEYDGTTTVNSTIIDEIKTNQPTYVSYTGLYPTDEVLIKSFDAVYDNENVDTGRYVGAKKITLTNITIDNTNYQLSNNSIDLNASITPKTLTITAQNVSKVYGTAKSSIAFTSKAEGLVGKDTDKLSDIVTISYSTTYDETVVENRNTGNYPITPVVTEKNANYTINPVDGSLAITKATIKVVAVSGNIAPTEGSYNDLNRSFSMTYGITAKAAWFEPEYTGWKYPEDNETSLSIDNNAIKYLINVPGAVITLDKTTITEGFPKFAGNYYISLDVSAINSTNYEFVAPNDTTRSVIHVDKRELELDSDITHILPKVYDATTKVYVSQLRLGNNATKEIEERDTSVVNYDASGIAVPTTEKVEYFVDNTSIDYSYLHRKVGTSGVLDTDIDELRRTGDTGIKVNYSVDKTFYNSKDVASASEVHLTYELSNYLAKRYRLVPTEPSVAIVSSNILRRPIKVKAIATPDSINYGSGVPVFSNKYIYTDDKGSVYEPGFAGSENNTILEQDSSVPSIGGTTEIVENGIEKWVTSYLSRSGTYSHVNAVTYEVKPYGFAAGNNGNYSVSYESGTISVNKAQLATPTVTWSDTTPGSVSFTSVPKIGDVEVDHYVLNLYEKTNLVVPVQTINPATPNTDYNLSSNIKNNGAGDYIVKVTAVASPINNEENRNVDDSLDGVTVKDLHAVSVTVGFKADAYTTEIKGKAAGDASTYARLNLNSVSADNYGNDTAAQVFIEGEKNITFGAQMNNANATGYKIKSVAATPNVVSFGTPTQSNSNKIRNYANEFNIGELTNHDPIDIRIALEHEEVTVSAILSYVTKVDSSEALSSLTDNLEYGYTQVPQFKVEAVAHEGDTVSVDDYTYTFYWYWKMGRKDNFVTDTPSGNVSIQSFPFGKTAANGHRVYCTIRATRKDNGQYIDYTTETSQSNGYFTINIAKSNIAASVSMNKVLPGTEGFGYIYGEERAIPSTVGLPADNTVAPKYYYSDSSDITGFGGGAVPTNWSEKLLTDAGEHYIVAYIAGQPNYGEYLTPPKKYTIKPATIGTVSNLAIGDATIADDYGKVTFTDADTIFENSKVAVDGNTCDSKVTPLYKIELYKDGSLHKSYEVQSQNTLSIANDIQEAGSYTVYVKAIPNPLIEKDCNNANEGSNVSISFDVGNIETTDESKLNRIYDGTATRINAVYNGKTITNYAWYKDGVLIKNGTDAFVDIRYVADSGTYYCVATGDDSTKYVSVKKAVRISQKEITLYSDGAEHVYDGTPLTKATYRAGVDGNDICTGDVVTLDLLNSQTVAGVSDNTITNVVITRTTDSDKVVYSDTKAADSIDNNYKVNRVAGKLKVTKRNITISANSANKTYDGTPLTCGDFTYTTMAELASQNAGLVTGETIVTGVAGLKMSADSTITNVCDSPKANSIDEGTIRILDASSNDVTSSYNITCVDGELSLNTVSLNRVTIKNADLIFTGNAVSVEDIKVYATKGGVDTLLLKDIDYIITEDIDNRKQTSATEVGAYIVQATGIGNYSGTVSVNYTIRDDVMPVIIGVSDNGIYCGDRQISIEDANIKNITIKKNDQLITLTEDEGSSSTKRLYTLSGSAAGDIFSIFVEDKSNNNVTLSNVTIYDDHIFRKEDYRATPYVSGQRRVMKANCYHGCGETDNKNCFHGVVSWNFVYSYDVAKADGTYETESGIQGKDARATYAKVELLRNGDVIATQMLDCSTTCGVDEDTVADSKAFEFDDYNPLNPDDTSGDQMLPMDGDYQIVITPMTYHGDEYAEALAYQVDMNDNYDTYFGYKGYITYHPDCFFVTWNVSLVDNPEICGKKIVPDALYVKILFGYNVTDADSDYAIISQQLEGLGEKCILYSNNGIPSYYGEYPVWKYQGHSHKSYYHRIQVTGYEYNGVYYDLESENYKSPVDEEYISYYDFEKDRVSHVIEYELKGKGDINMPMIILNDNNGGDITNTVSFNRSGVAIASENAIICKGAYDAPVSKSEIEEFSAARAHYEFLGFSEKPDWEEDAVLKDSYILSRDNSPITLYARWREALPPTGQISIGTYKWKEFLNSITFGLMFNKTQKVKIEGFDGENEYGVLNSGIDRIDYYVSSVSMNLTEIKNPSVEWNRYFDLFGIGLDPEEKVIVYSRIKDKAGNVAYISTEGLVIDKIAPEISGVDANTTYCEQKEITISDTNFDKLFINDVEVTPVDGRYTLSNNSAEFGMNFKIEATDKAGNRSVLNNVQINKGHAYAFDEGPVFNWNGTKSCTATFICEVDHSHEKLVKDCGITREDITDVGFGNVKFIAKVTENGKEFVSYRYSTHYAEGNFTKEVVYNDNTPQTNVGNFDNFHRKDAEKIIRLSDNRIVDAVTKTASENAIHFWLDVSKANREAIRDNGDEEKIRQAQIQLKDAEIWQLLDITLWFSINGGAGEKLISTGDEHLKVKLKLADEMINTDPNVVRKYHVVRVHHKIEGDEGDVKIYENPKYDSNEQTISFEADRFSTYAILYSDSSLKPHGNLINRVIEYYDDCYVNAGSRIRIIGKYNVISITDSNVTVVNVSEMKKFAVAKYNKKTGETIITTKPYKKIYDKNALYQIKIKNAVGRVETINVEIISNQKKYWKGRNVLDSSNNDFVDANTALSSNAAVKVNIKTIKGTDSVLRDIRWYGNKKIPLYTNQNIAKDAKGNVLFYYCIDIENGTITVAPAKDMNKAIVVTANINGKMYNVKFKCASGISNK